LPSCPNRNPPTNFSDESNIVTVHDYDDTGGVAYLVMELVDGVSMKELAVRTLASSDITRIVGDIASALDHAHSRGVFHRDVKPLNVMVRRDGAVKLADFGIAKVREITGVTQTGFVLGTIHYMPPEVLREQPFRAESDQYALGVIAYELFTGKNPFAAETTEATIARILMGAAPPICQAAMGLPAALNSVFVRVLAKEPAARYPSCTAFAEALSAAFATPEPVQIAPRAAVKRTLAAAADRVIAAYRDSDAAPVTQGQWERARKALLEALLLEPDDTIRGKLRLTEGHIARIEATARHDASQFNRSVQDFAEAARLLPDSPDPEIGLARVYISGLRDIDKASSAFQDAARRGFKLGRREQLLLADGFLERADRTFWASRSVRGLPQEKEQVQRAADDYSRALALYREISPFGDSAAKIARVETSLQSVKLNLAGPFRERLKKAIGGRN
jgi:hypothetical protein